MYFMAFCDFVIYLQLYHLMVSGNRSVVAKNQCIRNHFIYRISSFDKSLSFQIIFGPTFFLTMCKILCQEILFMKKSNLANEYVIRLGKSSSRRRTSVFQCKIVFLKVFPVCQNKLQAAATLRIQERDPNNFSSFNFFVCT